MDINKETKECLEYLKDTLESDYSVNPVQVVNAVYITPQGALNQQLAVIKRKRDMLSKVTEIINNLK